MTVRFLLGIIFVIFLFIYSAFGQDAQDVTKEIRSMGIDLEEIFVCEEKVNYTLNDQYPCECSPATYNTLTCDISKGVPKPKFRQNCKIGARWREGCNNCVCQTIGIVCTANKCS